MLAEDGKSYVCKARGRFRKDGVTPVPGDRTIFHMEADGEGLLAEILPRKNMLIRPVVANVDKLMIVLSASLPRPDFMLVDKLLVQCEVLGITPVLIFNKCDDCDEAPCRAMVRQYAPAGYRIITASARIGIGTEVIRNEIRDNVCCFAGQSAVGKSSLLNALLPELNLPVGGLSEKTDRGKHTTRHAELWRACGGALADTPGFSLLDLMELEPQDLGKYYPEMRQCLGECRFAECLHISEPGCAVKTLLEQGGLSRERYERYGAFLQELKALKKHRYD